MEYTNDGKRLQQGLVWYYQCFISWSGWIVVDSIWDNSSTHTLRICVPCLLYYKKKFFFFFLNALTHDLISQFFLSLVPWLCQGPSCLRVSALTESYCRKTHPLLSLRSWCQLSLCRSWFKCNELRQRGCPWYQQARHTHSFFIPLVCFISSTALLTSWNHFVLLSGIWFQSTRT